MTEKMTVIRAEQIKKELVENCPSVESYLSGHTFAYITGFLEAIERMRPIIAFMEFLEKTNTGMGPSSLNLQAIQALRIWRGLEGKK